MCTQGHTEIPFCQVGLSKGLSSRWRCRYFTARLRVQQACLGLPCLCDLDIGPGPTLGLLVPGITLSVVGWVAGETENARQEGMAEKEAGLSIWGKAG